MLLKKIFSLFVLLSFIASCDTTNSNDLFTKENIGTAAGAIGGAWIGSNVGKGKGQIVGIAAGTLLGAALGKSIGRSLDKADLAYHDGAAQTAFENNKTGVASSWNNPDSGHSGSVTPTRTYQTSSGEYCREYNQTINVGGQAEQAYGTACRQPDGSWKIIQ